MPIFGVKTAINFNFLFFSVERSLGILLLVSKALHKVLHFFGEQLFSAAIELPGLCVLA